MPIFPLNPAVLSRRRMLQIMGAAPAAAALSGLLPAGLARAAGAVNIYSWPDYFAQDDLDAYAKKSGNTPNISTYNANELMFAKLNSPAGAGFDIVIPSSGWIKQLVDKGLLLELDHSKVNLGALDPSLLNRDFDPGNKYSIPKDWGLLGVVYDPEAVGGEIKLRPMMYLAVSYDHRIIDGREAVLVLVRVKEGIEDPERLLLGV